MTPRDRSNASIASIKPKTPGEVRLAEFRPLPTFLGNALPMAATDAADHASSVAEEIDLVTRKLSITDWLTQLDNHSYSRRRLSSALDLAKREQQPLCVIMADLDHFKRINDTHGHLVGDDVLRIAAARMVAGARSGG